MTGWGSPDFTKLYNDLIQLDYNAANVDLEAYSGLTGVKPRSITKGGQSVLGPEPAYFDDATVYIVCGYISELATPDAVANNQGFVLDNQLTRLMMGPFPGPQDGVPVVLSQYLYAGHLTAGTHTLTLIPDVDRTVREQPGSSQWYTRTITVLPHITGLHAPGSALVAGNAMTLTVTLSGPAPAGGAQVTLSSSNPSALFVGPTLTVPAGQSSATFNVTAQLISSSQNASVTAIYKDAQADQNNVVHLLIIP